MNDIQQLVEEATDAFVTVKIDVPAGDVFLNGYPTWDEDFMLVAHVSLLDYNYSKTTGKLKIKMEPSGGISFRRINYEKDKTNPGEPLEGQMDLLPEDILQS